MTIAVTGASGQLGELTVEALQARGADNLVALVRNPAKVGSLGIEARTFDYDDADTLASALRGIVTLVLISSSEVGKRVAQHGNVVAAAKAAGVGRIIYTSVLRAEASLLSVAPEHVATETAIKSSGIAYTILRNGWYTENYQNSIAAALQHGALIGSSGDGRIAAAARADYAEALAVVATTGGHDGKTYELAGDNAFTLSDLAGEISRQAGRDIPYRDLPEADYAAALAGAGLPKGFADLIAGWDVAAAQGALFDDGRQLSTLIDRPTTPVSALVAAAPN